MRLAATALALATATVFGTACSNGEPTSPKLSAETPLTTVTVGDGGTYSPLLASISEAVRTTRPGVALASAEIRYKLGEDGWEGATTLLANDRTHLIGTQFVAADPRRGGGSDISYLVDQSDGAALSFNPYPTVVVLPNAVTEAAIDRSMATWAQKSGCVAPPSTKVADSGADPDLIDGIVFGDPARIGTPFADITHAGWLPAGFFNLLAPNGSASILGVTFTFIFVDNDGNPTDIDRDRRADAAFREIYYNRAVPWTDDINNTVRNVDIESVVIHEAGHAYGLAHFGKVFVDNNGFLKFAPEAMMNAVYVHAFRTLTGTDNASFCAIWGKR